jgi:hypothetical protein
MISAVSKMGSCSTLIANGDILSELYAHQFSDLSEDRMSETETLDTDIVTTSLSKWS